MNRDQLKRLIQGPIATLPSAFDGNFQLDTAVMADQTEWWIERGLRTGTSVLKVAAAMGEGPDLNDDEWPRLLRTVVDAARGWARRHPGGSAPVNADAWTRRSRCSSSP